MKKHPAEEFRGRISAAYQRLSCVSESQASLPYRPGGWLRKEVLGHLLDSAANNHIRIAHAAVAGHFEGPAYAQEEWVRMHNYAALDWSSLLKQWHDRNLLIGIFIEHIPEDRLSALCRIGESAPVPLGFIITDYLDHMDHHISQIVTGQIAERVHSAGIARTQHAHNGRQDPNKKI